MSTRSSPPNQASHRPWTPPTREEILQFLQAANAPLTPRELGDALGVPPAHVDTFAKRIATLERDGQLMLNRKGVLLLPAKLELEAGKVVGHRDGYGFVMLDAGGPDVYLSAREMRKAMHGDRVLVKRVGFDRRGKPEGVIVEVTARANRRLVGRLLNERGVTVVVPEDQRIKHDVLIPAGDAGTAKPGQVVTVEIVEQPSGFTDPIGRVVEVLGDIDDPGMEIEIAVRKFDVPYQFDPAAVAQAERLPGQVEPADRVNRVDLTDIDLVTIDGEDARDFDDAVWCEATDGGQFRLLVAIADVSHYVRGADALDTEAARRSTSVYFPRRVIPMLPEKLSNGLCSLNPQVDRLVLVCDMVIDARGEITAYQFFEAVMHSAARLTYDEVWGILSGRDQQARQRRAPLLDRLQHLYDLYRVLAKARIERGAMDFDTVETRIVCDPAGRIERIEPYPRNDAHRLIEECMLAANVCAADIMARAKHPGLYRVHEGPTPEKLAALHDVLRQLALNLDGGDSPSPQDYARLALQIRSRPDAVLLQTLMLRSMQQAIYTPHNSGHFGLAYPGYTHFTSPIRRYPDLLTHRVIKAVLADQRTIPADPEPHADADVPRPRRGGKLSDAQVMQRWERYGELCSFNERRADDASRDVQAWLKCQYMRERVGEQFVGRITGVAPFGVFVTLDALFVEGMVHVSELGAEYFQFNPAGHELRGERTGRRFRLTDPLEVQVAKVDLEARRIEFRLVSANLSQVSMPAAPDDEAKQAKQESRVPAVKRKAKPKTAEVEHVRKVRRGKQLARRNREPRRRGR